MNKDERSEVRREGKGASQGFSVESPEGYNLCNIITITIHVSEGEEHRGFSVRICAGKEVPGTWDTQILTNDVIPVVTNKLCGYRTSSNINNVVI